MTEEQKRYKILKRTSYEEQITQENKRAVNKTFLAGFSATAAVFGLLVSANQSAEITPRLICLGLGLINSGFSTYHFKNAIESISRKTMLQGKVENINEELEMPENENSKGMSR